MPGSQGLAERNSRARAVEGVKDHVSGGKGTQDYIIPALYLGAIWEKFLELYGMEGNHDFIDAFLFIQAKGIKTS
jgi:hypothetical protein